MTTYRTLKAQIMKLEKQAADLLKKEAAEVVAKIQAMMNEYGLTVADLGAKWKAAKAAKAPRKTKVTKPAGIPKYRDPVSGKTWTGFGKAPGWLVNGIKNGKSKDDFLIGKKAPAAKAATKAPAKPVAKTAKAATTAKVSKPAQATKTTKTAKAPQKPAVKKPAAKPSAPAAKPAKAAARKAPTRKPVTKAPVAPAAVDRA